MTGPEHYQVAEDLLRSPGLDAHGIAEAQVHATLALAAATATGMPDHPAADWDAWYRMASEMPGQIRRARIAEAAEAADLAEGP